MTQEDVPGGHGSKCCPSCGSPELVLIQYGLPAFTPELEADLEVGRVVLGGCVVEPSSPAYRCQSCGGGVGLAWPEHGEFADRPDRRPPDDEMAMLHLGGELLATRQLAHPVALLDAYREDEGTRYLDYVPITPPDQLMPEDLAVTILINSRVGYRAFKSVQDFGPSLDLASLPSAPLEQTTEEERDRLASVIAEVAAWPGFAASVATKVLHKKRPVLVPILDNQAIFGAYLARTWPRLPSSRDSVKDESCIREAIEAIARDLTREENRHAWSLLHERQPSRSRIELFDMVWWSYFRTIEDTSGTLQARLAALATFKPVFERADLEFGTWAGGEERNGVIQMPYYSFGPEAKQFIAMTDEYGWVTPFDWGAWTQTPEGQQLLDGGEAIDAATPEDLSHVLTAIIRAERFGDGQLAHAFHTGLLLSIVRRAAVLASEGASSAVCPLDRLHQDTH